MKGTAIIVAGGIGKRMDEEIPKQFLLLQGKPIIIHSMEIFWNYDHTVKIILVLHEGYAEYWKKICRDHRFEIPHKRVPGGQTRFHSVKNAVQHVDDDAYVAIHDAVRPLVSMETLKRCFDAAYKYGNAVPFIDVPESVRRVKDKRSEPVERTGLKSIQTPQVFRGDLLKSAFKQEYLPEFTDDARVVEKMGYEIHLVEGNRENIKITNKEDLIMAEALIKNR